MERFSHSRLIPYGLLLMGLAALLFNACSKEKITLTASPPIYGNPASDNDNQRTASIPTVTARAEPTEPVVLSDVAPTDIVHLGVPWADFSLRFDPLQWKISAFNDDWPDLQSLTHLTLAGCRITPNIPVGLGEDWSIKDRQITPGQLELHARSFYQSGVLKFVGYYNFLNPYGDGAVEVHFEDNRDACIQAAEALFAATEVTLP